MATKRDQPIRNLVFVGDTHIGCQLGLMHPDGAVLDEGPTVRPSQLQRTVWRWWRQFWDEFVPEAVSGEPYAVVHMGDCIDGTHHGSTHQWTHSITHQMRHAVKILGPVVAGCEGRYYHVRGTEAHVGPSSCYDDEVAKALGAIPSRDGQAARYELWKRIGPRLVHAAHHIGVSGSHAYESSAPMREVAEMMLESARWGHQFPDAVVRGHRHRSMHISVPTERTEAHVVITPGWQLKTPFTFRVMGGRVSQPQFGGVVLRWSETHKELFVRKWVRSLSREDPE